jgi:8-oxo-dGTP pyrophosphatase MutT (NUDIX family)
MGIDRPPPGQDLNLGEEAPPRAAASVIVLRDGDEGLEVLLVQRNPESKFMGGAWVFPGGAVHDKDAGDPRRAGLRELEEEAGLGLKADDLVAFSRWITPAEVTIRFDTHFFVASAPDGVEPRCDGRECVALRWLPPSSALELGERGELMLVFPTIKHLEQLARFQSVEDALETAQGRRVEPVQPRVVLREGAADILLPGEPGYDEAAGG